jgi:hypothetical protein
MAKGRCSPAANATSCVSRSSDVTATTAAAACALYRGDGGGVGTRLGDPRGGYDLRQHRLDGYDASGRGGDAGHAF